MNRLTERYVLIRQFFTGAVTGLTLIMSSAVYADNLATLQQIIEKTVTSNPEVQARSRRAITISLPHKKRNWLPKAICCRNWI
jgi:hypothetical protein